MDRIRIVLENAGGELDRQDIEASGDDASGEIYAALASWSLAAGDTIRIITIESES
jgi:hypothetical protein